MARTAGVGAVLAMVVAVFVGVPSASAAGLVCGSEVHHSITLHHDIGPCPLSGLIVKAGGITIDLNGHTLGGDSNDGDANPTTEFGIDNTEGHPKVTVVGGKITGFEDGISIAGARRNHFAHLFVTTNTDIGIAIGNGSHHTTVGRCHVTFNTMYGINSSASNATHVARNRVSDNGGGIGSDGLRDVISNNVVRHNTYGGILLDSQNGVVRNNTVDANGSTNAGIEIRGSQGMQVVNNTVTGADTAPIGIELYTSYGPVVSGNHVSAHDGRGIWALDAYHAQILGNVVRKNAAYGMDLADTYDSVVKDNTVSGHGYGIYLEDDSGWTAASTDDRVIGNTLSNNITGIALTDATTDGTVVSKNILNKNVDGIYIDGPTNSKVSDNVAINGEAFLSGGTGIYVTSASSNAILTSNHANGNTGDGIHVESGSTTLTDNVARKNGDDGIEATVAVTDLGGNRASGNADQQCVNVSCPP